MNRLLFILATILLILLAIYFYTHHTQPSSPLANEQAVPIESSDELMSSHTDYELRDKNFKKQYDLQKLPLIQVDLSFLDRIEKQYHLSCQDLATGLRPDAQLTKLEISFPNYENPDQEPTIRCFFYSPQSKEQIQIKQQSLLDSDISQKKLSLSQQPAEIKQFFPPPINMQTAVTLAVAAFHEVAADKTVQGLSATIDHEWRYWKVGLTAFSERAYYYNFKVSFDGLVEEI
ncbi:MAG: hypothetical protein PVJ09_00330 [Candidatus Woesebacteria bacterium]|jgi:hypothetical protein